MKFKNLFKNNYPYFVFIVFITFLVVFFQFLFLNDVDDRVYSTVAKASLTDTLYFMEYHYNFCNGRTLMHLLLIFFLKFDVYLWRVICPLSFGLLIILSSMFVSYDKDSFKKSLLLFSVISLFVSVDIYESTLFWATGSFNYVFPFLFLLLTLLLIKYKKCIYLIPVLGFMCGATTEQCGIISVFCFAMYIYYNSFVLKNKVKKTVILTLFTSIAGFFTVVLSPSVIARTYESNSSFFDKLSMIIFNLWFKSEGMMTFIILLMFVVSIKWFSLTRTKLNKWIVGFISFTMFLTLFLQYTSISVIAVLSQYAFLLLLLLGITVVCISCILREKNYYPLFSMLLGMGAQFMMAVSQRFSYRTTLPSIFCFIFFAVSVLIDNDFLFSMKKKFLSIKIVLAIVSSLIIIFNIFGYLNLSAKQIDLLQEKKYTVSHFNSRQTREDVDKIIDECEKVRLEQIEKNKT